MDVNRKDLLNEYENRYVRWTQMSSSQLSFYNNLLLTLGVGFLSFAYKSVSLHKIKFSLKSPDMSLTFYVMSLILTAISVLLGFLVNISRLYDFRLTRHINLVRKRTLEHSGEKLDERTPERYSYWKVFFLIFQVGLDKYPHITIEQCKKLGEIIDKEKQGKFHEDFRTLRNLAYNFGRFTWKNTFWQTILFALAIACYMVAELL